MLEISIEISQLQPVITPKLYTKADPGGGAGGTCPPFSFPNCMTMGSES